MALKLKEYRSSFDRGPALADFLPYDNYDDGVFILKDGSLGMMWSLATITEEGLSEEGLLISVGGCSLAFRYRDGKGSPLFIQCISNANDAAGFVNFAHFLTGRKKTFEVASRSRVGERAKASLFAGVVDG